jgi:hypothetical protein
MIVVTGNYGQLGNRLVVFAHLIAAAREHGLRIANPAFWPYATYFENTSHDAWCRFPVQRTWVTSPRAGCVLNSVLDHVRPWVRKLRNRTGALPPLLRTLEIGWDRACDLDGPVFLDLARRPGLLLIRGWRFRAMQSLQRHAETVRQFFRPAEAHRQAVTQLSDAVRERGDVVVGVHIRQGDYRNFLGSRFYFDAGDYAALMEHLTDLFPHRRVAFLVCSNVPQPSAAFANLDVTFGTGHEAEDLYALAACDYLAGPPSTYTLWASFYGGIPLYQMMDAQATPEITDFLIAHDFERTADRSVTQMPQAYATAACLRSPK